MIKYYDYNNIKYYNSYSIVINDEELSNLDIINIYNKKYCNKRFCDLILHCNEITQNIKIDVINDKLYINNEFINIYNYIKMISICDCNLNNINLNINNSNFLEVIYFSNYKKYYDFSNLKIKISNCPNLSIFKFYYIKNNLNQLLNIIKNLDIDFNNILFQFYDCNLEYNTNIKFIKHINLDNTILNLNKLLNLKSLIIKNQYSLTKVVSFYKKRLIYPNDINYNLINMYKFLNLEYLELQKDNNIKEIPDNLINLKTLILNECQNIIKLPNNLINLNILKIINNNTNYDCNCHIKEIPNNLINLKILILIKCKNIKKLPNTLINLEELVLYDCNDIEIPKTFINLKKIIINTKEYYEFINHYNLPNTLINLEYLELYNYKLNYSLLNNLTNLNYLKLIHCNIKKLSNNLINLEELILEECNDIEIPKTLINLKKLTIIQPNYSNFINYYKLPNTLINLEELDLQDFIFKKLPLNYINLQDLLIRYDHSFDGQNNDYFEVCISKTNKQEIKDFINKTNGLKINCSVVKQFLKNKKKLIKKY